MSAIKKQSTGRLLGMFLWLLWMTIVFSVIAFAIYLFINGSVFFREINTPTIVIYQEYSDGQSSLSGSVPLTKGLCGALTLNVDDTKRPIELAFKTDSNEVCKSSDDVDVQTFYTTVQAQTPLKDTDLRVTVNGDSRDIIIK